MFRYAVDLEEDELREIMSRNVYSMEADDTYVNGSNGKGVMDYLMCRQHQNGAGYRILP